LLTDKSIDATGFWLQLHVLMISENIPMRGQIDASACSGWSLPGLQ
jgi:hypothetical protein